MPLGVTEKWEEATGASLDPSGSRAGPRRVPRGEASLKLRGLNNFEQI